MTKAEDKAAAAALPTHPNPVIEEELQRREKAKILRAAESAEIDAHRSVVHTYPDGSQRVGIPPFPELSPDQEKAKAKRESATRPMIVPPGMKTSGGAPEGTLTAADLEGTPISVDNPDAADLEAIARAIEPSGGENDDAKAKPTKK